MFFGGLVLLFDLAFTILITLVIPVGHGHHYWAPFLLLIAGFLLGIGLLWGVLVIIASFYKKDKTYDKPRKLAAFCLSEGIGFIKILGRIKLKVNGDRKLPKERFLIVCNHRSKFDPMLMIALWGKRGLAFISKPTNFKVPVGGHFMKACCFLSIDRYDKLKSLEVINEAIELVKSGMTSIGVFPEGTRYDDGEVHEFHEGVFSIAKKTGCPIVICSIEGTENIHKNFPKKKTKVNLNILEIMYSYDYQDKIVKQISDHTQELIRKSLEK